MDLTDPSLIFPVQFQTLPKQKKQTPQRQTKHPTCPGFPRLHLCIPWEALRLVPLGPKNPKVFWELPTCLLAYHLHTLFCLLFPFSSCSITLHSSVFFFSEELVSIGPLSTLLFARHYLQVVGSLGFWGTRSLWTPRLPLPSPSSLVCLPYPTFHTSCTLLSLPQLVCKCLGVQCVMMDQ